MQNCNNTMSAVTLDQPWQLQIVIIISSNFVGTVEEFDK